MWFIIQCDIYKKIACDDCSSHRSWANRGRTRARRPRWCLSYRRSLRPRPLSARPLRRPERDSTTPSWTDSVWRSGHLRLNWPSCEVLPASCSRESRPYLGLRCTLREERAGDGEVIGKGEGDKGRGRGKMKGEGRWAKGSGGEGEGFVKKGGNRGKGEKRKRSRGMVEREGKGRRKESKRKEEWKNVLRQNRLSLSAILLLP